MCKCGNIVSCQGDCGCKFEVNAGCVRYTGDNLESLGVIEGDTLEVILEELNNRFSLTDNASYLDVSTEYPGANCEFGGVKIQLKDRVSDDIITTEYVCTPKASSGATIVDITYNNLKTLVNTTTLEKGQKYRITDFQTIYDQPDFDSNGDPKSVVTVKYGPIEPIVVTATSNNTLSLRADQPSHPNTVIEYLFAFTTPKSLTETKGRIIRMIDEYNNEGDYDFRNVLFKRYYDPILDRYSEHYDNGEEFQEFTTFVPNYGDAKSNNNKLGETFSFYVSKNDNDLYIIPQYSFDLPNIVLGIYPGGNSLFNNNIFKGYVMSATIANNASDNEYTGFVANFYTDDCYKNKIGKIYNGIIKCNSMNSNNISGIYEVNILCDTFYNNTLGFISDISGIFSLYEVSADQIYTITIAPTKQLRIQQSKFNRLSNTSFLESCYISFCNFNQFVGNTVRTSTFSRSNIKEFYNNTLLGGVFYNNTGDRIASCTFKGMAANNNFGLRVEGCIFGDYFGDEYTLEFNGDAISNTGEIEKPSSNIFKAWVSNSVFGDYCSGNIFENNISNYTFGSYLRNNTFNQLVNNMPMVELGVPELYENFKTNVFALRKPHFRSYNVGDMYYYTPSIVNYRSETIDGTINNYFTYSSYGTDCKFQYTNSNLDTVNGLNNSDTNSNYLSKDYDPTLLVANGDCLASVLQNTVQSMPQGLRAYIPTLAELQIIYNNKTALGITLAEKIWSSTEDDIDNAFVIDFATGTTSSEAKSSVFKTIPIVVKTWDYKIHISYNDEYSSEITKSINI
jgi:hypothetical protein